VDPTDLHLSGLESFSFDYMVKWPVSLVLNRKVSTVVFYVGPDTVQTCCVQRSVVLSVGPGTEICCLYVGPDTEICCFICRP
jgi:hypothetical protein